MRTLGGLDVKARWTTAMFWAESAVAFGAAMLGYLPRPIGVFAAVLAALLGAFSWPTDKQIRVNAEASVRIEMQKRLRSQSTPPPNNASTMHTGTTQ